MEVEHILKIGYINALEFQKPKVEGILINNLKDIPTPVGLVSGSDCHQWTYYPYHDAKNQNKFFHHSRANILPTFKGLLMAVTSPETRFNCRENSNPIYFNEVVVDGKTVKLTNGINAIIGENGSGKSTLIKFLNNDIKEKHVQKIIHNSNIFLPQKVDLSKIKYIQQGEIISKFNNNKQVFSITDDNYKEIDNSAFNEAYTEFSQSLLSHIKNEIRKKATVDLLKNYEVQYKLELEEKVYFISIICPKDFDTIANKHSVPLKKVEKLIKEIDGLKNSDDFQDYKTDILIIRKQLFSIYKDIFSKYQRINIEEKIKNIICSCITDYTSNITNNSSSKDREINEYNEKKQRLIDAVCSAIKITNIAVPYEKSPSTIKGATSSSKRGFYFNREAKIMVYPWLIISFLLCS
jgi:energy-coupling factor transporter ATP-binding protein EcfA2